MATVFISDLHGHTNKIESLWAKLEDHLGEEGFESGTFVFLGDYVDRGPDSQGTLDFLTSLDKAHPRQTHVFLAGNHDFSMAAFLGLLPPLPADLLPFSFKRTWEHEIPYRDWEKASWWKGESQILDNMHLQGRRWGGGWNGRSVYNSESTFKSYGVNHGDRQGLLDNMPEAHTIFLSKLEWVHDTTLSNGARAVSLHAGLLPNISLNAQLKKLQVKDYRNSHIEWISGRDNVLHMHPELQGTDAYLISGHHGFTHLDGRRFVIDESGGHAHKPIAALVLPEEQIIHSE